MGKYTLSLSHTPHLIEDKLGTKTILNVEQVSQIYPLVRDGCIHQCFDVIVKGFSTNTLNELLQRGQMFDCVITSGSKQLPAYKHKSVYLIQLDSTLGGGFFKDVATFSITSIQIENSTTQYLKGE